MSTNLISYYFLTFEQIIWAYTTHECIENYIGIHNTVRADMVEFNGI